MSSALHSNVVCCVHGFRDREVPGLGGFLAFLALQYTSFCTELIPTMTN